MVRKLDKKKLIEINKEMENYNNKKYLYLAFNTLVISIAELDEYIVGSSIETQRIMGIEKYFKISEELIENLSKILSTQILSGNILEKESANFFKWVIQKVDNIDCVTTDLSEDSPYKIEGYKELDKKLLIVYKNKKDTTLKYLEIKRKDYDFLQNITKILKIMNIILKGIDLMENYNLFSRKYVECIYMLQRIIDYKYFKENLENKKS